MGLEFAFVSVGISFFNGATDPDGEFRLQWQIQWLNFQVSIPLTADSSYKPEVRIDLMCSRLVCVAPTFRVESWFEG